MVGKHNTPVEFDGKTTPGGNQDGGGKVYFAEKNCPPRGKAILAYIGGGGVLVWRGDSPGIVSVSALQLLQQRLPRTVTSENQNLDSIQRSTNTAHGRA